MENADFLQFGQIHRNTFINSPQILNEALQTRKKPNIFFAGQITGVEGYIESVGTGWLAGINAARLAKGEDMITAPNLSAIGALCRYVSNVETKNFQPVNITFGLLEQLPVELRKKHRNKRERHIVQVELALKEWDEFLSGLHFEKPGGTGSECLRSELFWRSS